MSVPASLLLGLSPRRRAATDAIDRAGGRDHEVDDRKNVTIFHARMRERIRRRAGIGSAERAFRKTCSSALRLFSPEWPA